MNVAGGRGSQVRLFLSFGCLFTRGTRTGFGYLGEEDPISTLSFGIGRIVGVGEEDMVDFPFAPIHTRYPIITAISAVINSAKLEITLSTWQRKKDFLGKERKMSRVEMVRKTSELCLLDGVLAAKFEFADEMCLKSLQKKLSSLKPKFCSCSSSWMFRSLFPLPLRRTGQKHSYIN